MFKEFILEGVSTTVFWFFVGFGVIILGIGKTGFGGGIGILAIPVMMLVMPVDKVVASLLPLMILMDLNAVYHHWSNGVWKVIFDLCVPACVGIFAGAALWWWIGQEGIEGCSTLIKRFVGIVSILFAVFIVSKEKAFHWVSRVRLGRGSAWAFGLLTGASSTIAHAAGPVASLYIFAQDLGKPLFVGTMVWTFMLINLTKLPFYWAVDLIREDILLFDLWVVWLIPIGSYLGKWMYDRISEKTFNLTIMVLFVAVGIQMLTDVNLVRLVFEDAVRTCALATG